MVSSAHSLVVRATFEVQGTSMPIFQTSISIAFLPTSNETRSQGSFAAYSTIFEGNAFGGMETVSSPFIFRNGSTLRWAKHNFLVRYWNVTHCRCFKLSLKFQGFAIRGKTKEYCNVHPAIHQPWSLAKLVKHRWHACWVTHFPHRENRKLWRSSAGLFLICLLFHIFTKEII